MPAGPEPTIATSTTSASRSAETRPATRSITRAPCATALRTSAMPRTSPARKSPRMSVSFHSSTCGMSARDLRSPRPTWIALTGHASSQRAWPTQRIPLMTVAVPPTTPSTSPSGQAATHAPQPMQRRGSMYGNCAVGRTPSAAASCLRARSRCCRRRKEIV